MSAAASVLHGWGDGGRRVADFPQRGSAVPHKLNAEKRRGASRLKRRVTNWAEYDRALRQLGSLTVWFTEEAV